MPTLTRGIDTGEWLVSDAGTRSRDAGVVTVALNTALPSGTVLGKITATGKYVPHDNGAANGAQLAAAILLHPIEAGAARDVKAALYVRDCEVWGAKLNNGAGVTSDQITELDARGIAVR